jgi:hypothetical protein
MDFHSTSFQAGQAKGQAQVLVLHMFIIYYFLKQFLQAWYKMEGMHALSFMHMNYDMK